MNSNMRLGKLNETVCWSFTYTHHFIYSQMRVTVHGLSVFHLRLVRTVSLRISLLVCPVHGFRSVQTVRSTPKIIPCASCSSQTRLGVSDQTVHSKSQRLWNSQLPVAECFQSPSMLCPKPLQCLSPTLQPQSFQNSSHQFLFANLVRRTKRKAHLCSTNAWAHLLFAWTIVATTVEQFIHG